MKLKYKCLIAAALGWLAGAAVKARGDDVTYLRLKQDDGSYKVVASSAEKAPAPKAEAKPAKKGYGAECVCGSECKCDEGRCPGGCPVQPATKTEPAPVWLTDLSAACTERARTGKTLVVLFTNPATCLPCRRLEAGTLTSHEVKTALAQCLCVRVDTVTEAGQRTLADFARGGDPVTQWPTLRIYNGSGPVVKHTGEISAHSLLAKLSGNGPLMVWAEAPAPTFANCTTGR